MSRKRSILLVESMLSNDQFSINNFCHCIPQEDYRLLREELLGSLGAESGSLPLDPQVLREAESLVFKTFGASRRLSERDKKQISRMIAMKSQIIELEAKREANRLTQEIKLLRQQDAELEDVLTDLAAKTRTTLAGQKFRALHENYADMRTTSEALTQAAAPGNNAMKKEKDALTSIEEMVDFLLTRVSRIVTENEWAEYKLAEYAEDEDAAMLAKGKRLATSAKFDLEMPKLVNHRVLSSSDGRFRRQDERLPDQLENVDGAWGYTDEDDDQRGAAAAAAAEDPLSPQLELERLKREIAQKEKVLRAKDKTFEVLAKEVERSKKERATRPRSRTRPTSDAFTLPQINA